MKLLSLAPLHGPGLQRLHALGDLVVDPWIDHVPIKLHSAEELQDRIHGFDVLLVEADHVSAAVIEASGLIAIGTCRGDPINVEIQAATAAGIAVLRAPARNARAVAELTLGLTLSLLRSIRSADADVRSGRFVVDQQLAQQRYKGREIPSLTIGIVGLGAVGRETAKLFRALGATIIASDPYVSSTNEYHQVPLAELLRSADIVSLHAAVTSESKDMIGEHEFGMMKQGTILVNTARFGLVEESALIEALRSGKIAAAAFDHFTNEFLPSGHPLTTMPNVLLTPHIGGTTAETIERHTMIMAEGLESLLKGEAPATLVNPECMPLFRKRLQS